MTAPSALPIFLVLAKIIVMMLTTTSTARSVTDARFTVIGCIVPEIPRINSRLKIFEPTTFPTARPFSPLRDATTEVTSSGSDVPVPIQLSVILL